MSGATIPRSCAPTNAQPPASMYEIHPQSRLTTIAPRSLDLVVALQINRPDVERSIQSGAGADDADDPGILAKDLEFVFGAFFQGDGRSQPYAALGNVGNEHVMAVEFFATDQT